LTPSVASPDLFISDEYVEWLQGLQSISQGKLEKMTKQPPTKSLRTVLLEKAFYIVFDAPIQLSYRHIFRQLLFFFFQTKPKQNRCNAIMGFFSECF